MANNFQVFGKQGSNLLTPYASNSEVLNGYQPNTVINSATMNSVLKQNSLVTYAIANYIVTNQFGDTNDFDITMTEAEANSEIEAFFNKLYGWNTYLTQTDVDHTPKFLVGYYDAGPERWEIEARHTDSYVWPKSETTNSVTLSHTTTTDPQNGDVINLKGGPNGVADAIQLVNAAHAYTATNADYLHDSNYNLSATTVWSAISTNATLINSLETLLFKLKPVKGTFTWNVSTSAGYSDLITILNEDMNPSLYYNLTVLNVGNIDVPVYVGLYDAANLEYGLYYIARGSNPDRIWLDGAVNYTIHYYYVKKTSYS